MPRLTKALLILVALLVTVTLLLTGRRGQALHENFAVTTGSVLRWLPQAKGGGKVEFTYTVEGIRYTELCSVPLPRCPLAVNVRGVEYRDTRFLVAYQPRSPDNAELLLHPSQYRRYGMAVPDSLREVMARLASCR